ncbi:dedicator of cytokinesis protein 9, partial [Camelus ferus]
MQADKCRTSSRNVKKELVIESPVQCKDAAQGEVEAESPGPVLAKPKLIEPLDYENVIVQKKTQILNDCLREMLLFPYDDFQTAILRRQGRYRCSTIPENAQEKAQSLFVTECIKTYNSDWHLVNYKYEDYSGEFRQLPNKAAKLDKLPVHVYEVDEEVDKDEDAASLGSQKGGITKHGWLYKGNMNSAISVTMRFEAITVCVFFSQSFKRRFFHLIQLGDGSYNLNFYKDEKISKEPKGSIFLDSCMGVVQNNKVRRFAFELKMQDKSSYLLAADSEVEMEEWMTILNKILQLNFEAAMQEKRNGDSHEDDEQSKLEGSGSGLDSYLPELAKVEPFFVTLSLFDIKYNRKISADFHVDLNHFSVRQMLAATSPALMNGGRQSSPALQDIPHEAAMQYPKQGIFSVTCPHPDIFLVARIEKVLQGSITHGAEPYMKSSDSSKVAQKVLKNAKQACQRLGQYRMPFAWAARTLFKDASGNLDKNARFSALYKQDSNKLSNEDMLKLLADFRKPEKMAKLPVILGNLDITIDNVSSDLPNYVNSSYIPMKQFETCTKTPVTFEVEEFVPCIPKHTQPYTIYNNHLYVYPKYLKYDSQKSFAKARNIAICIEFKDSDEEDSQPLKHYGPEIKWVDGSKPLLKVSTHLVSTVYTQDQHLHNFFQYCQKTESGAHALGNELVKYLKSLHAMEGHVMIAFLPTILNQLFRVLTRATQEEVAVNVTRVIIHMVAQCHEEGLESHLRSYVKYAYKAEPYVASEYKTVHEELAKSMTTILKPSADFLTSNKLLKLLRNQRFPASYHHAVETVVNMLMPHITQKFRDNPEASKNANHSLAVFIKRCFTFMDRGFVFKQINNYISCFAPGDPKTLFEYKFEFLRVVCNHEHYIPLNLPMPFGKGRIQRYQDLQLDYALTDEFCRNHFLVGLLLREVGTALQEFREVRLIAISVLKNLLIKHSFDDRYASRSHQARIATLYLPLFGLLIENVQRINVRDVSPFPVNPGSTVKEESLTLPAVNPLVTPQKSGNTLDSSLHKDLFGAISGIGFQIRAVFTVEDFEQMVLAVWTVLRTVEDILPRHQREKLLRRHSTCVPRGAGEEEESGQSARRQRVTVDFSLLTLPPLPEEAVPPAPHIPLLLAQSSPGGSAEHQQSGTLGNSVVRCDKLDQSEIKSLLMCFLYILKSMSDAKSQSTEQGKAVLVPPSLPADSVCADHPSGYREQHNMEPPLHLIIFSRFRGTFQRISENQKVCLHQFQYMGKRYIARNQEGLGPIVHDRKSQTLPVSRNRTGMMHARLQQLGSLDNSLTFNHSYGHSDADVLHQSLLEANIATEVCLTALDTLSLFTLAFK